MTDPAFISRPADDPLDRAMRHIESHRLQTLSLESLAGVAGLSAYHFARQFTARFGVSPMAYARARRMAAAAEQLSAARRPALVELAFDCGFETQEGFTRAFKRAYGVSPGRYRPPAIQETAAMADPTPVPNLTMRDRPEQRPGFRAAGFCGLFDEATRHQIPALWPRLIQRLPLAGQAGYETYGVCCGEDSAAGQFHYMAAVAIAPDAPAPEGMEVREVAAQTYLIFRQDLAGPDLHPQMQAAVKSIWGDLLPKSGYELTRGPDLEFYPADFQPGIEGGWVEWWVPVRA